MQFIAKSGSINISEYEVIYSKPMTILPAVEEELKSLSVRVEDPRLSNASIRSLNDIISKEISWKRWLRWAAVDNLAEKVLQGAILTRADLDLSVTGCSRQIRQMPRGRSFFLQTDRGLMKVDAIRGFVKTTYQVFDYSVRIFVFITLSYNLNNYIKTGEFEFAAIKAIFQSNSAKGVTSLVQGLARVDQIYLRLLLASPFVIGALKGIWNGCRSKPPNQEDIQTFQEEVKQHIENNSCCGFRLWEHWLRQLLPFPCYPNLRDRIRRAEQWIRWDGRIDENRLILFKRIDSIAIHGRGLNRLDAIESLAKIVHSLSILDLKWFTIIGAQTSTVIQILQIKARALQTIRQLASRKNRKIDHSLLSYAYANYYLWWLGCGNWKHTAIFGVYKNVKLVFQTLFLKEIVEIILEAIRCPDKPGFNVFSGDFEVWANELSEACFNEFIRQFRLLSKDESFEFFQKELANFNLDNLDTLNLGNKALTAYETNIILQILSKKMKIKNLNLSGNQIGKEIDKVVFPEGLETLYLRWNNIYPETVSRVRFPESLLVLDLTGNNLGPIGAEKLQLPAALRLLNLSQTNMTDSGVTKLKLPSSLLDLDISLNKLTDDWSGLSLPADLLALNLMGNHIGYKGVKKLKLPHNLTKLDLSYNDIGSGFKELQLPSLEWLILKGNRLGAEGVDGLHLPATLERLDLSDNELGTLGAKQLRLPPNLQFLELNGNRIRDQGLAALQFPPTLFSLNLEENLLTLEEVDVELPQFLQFLVLKNNLIGDKGVAKLRFSPILVKLDLSHNVIGKEGAQKLRFPESLQDLLLDSNRLGTGGVNVLQLPDSLESLGLDDNAIAGESFEGVKLPDQLKRLSLQKNDMGKGFNKVKLPRLLEVLWVEENNIDDNSMEGVDLPPTLVHLALSDNDLTSKGVENLRFPPLLWSLNLDNNRLNASGAKKLKLPYKLSFLRISGNYLGNEGIENLQLPQSLVVLGLAHNQISDSGVKVLLKKIAQTNLNEINLFGNPYNASAIKLDRVLQQQALLRRCQDQLCHANTPLLEGPHSEVAEMQVSSASRRYSTGVIDWISAPFKAIAVRVDKVFTNLIRVTGSKLETVLKDCPSYFPNIRSPIFHDFHAPGPIGTSGMQPSNFVEGPRLLQAPAPLSVYAIRG